MEKTTFKEKQDEMRNKESERKEEREKILEAIKRLENERMETNIALSEINERLPLSMGMYYLGNVPMAEMMRILQEREERRNFIGEIYPLMKQGLLLMLMMEYKNDGSYSKQKGK